VSYYVYLIGTFNKNDDLITYVGYTNNLSRRLYLHNNSKGAKFTRGRNWKLIFKKKFISRKNAMKFEYISFHFLPLVNLAPLEVLCKKSLFLRLFVYLT